MQRFTLPRRLTQIAFLILTGEWLTIGWLRCPFGVPFVSCMSCPLRGCPGTWLQPYFIALLGISGLLLGRAFCGWGCPMGLLEEVLGRIPRPRLEKLRGFARVDCVLKWLRWPALVAVIYLVFALNYPAERAHPYVVRTASAFNIDAVRLAWNMGVKAYWLRTVVLVGALAGALVVVRAWCRYLCPLGTLLGLFNRFSLVKLSRDETACRHCGKYPRDCMQHTMPGTSDCVICAECLDGCPYHAVGFRVRNEGPTPEESVPGAAG